MFKRFVSIVLAAGLVMGITACAGKPAGETSDGSENKGAQSTQSAGSSQEAQSPNDNQSQEVLHLWHYWDSELQQGLLQEMVDNYQKDTGGPKIEVSYIPYSEYIQKLLVSAAGGDLPELFIYDGNSTATLAEAGVLADITDKINESGVMKDTLPGVVEEHEVEGRLYGFPVYANCLALFYRTDIVETPPTTWSELYDTAKAVATPEMYGFAMAGGAGEDAVFQYLPFIWSAGADINDLSAPGAVEPLDMFTRMINEGIMSKDTVNHSQEDAEILFETGRAAMMINGPWNVPPIQENAPDLEWSVTLIPKADNGEYASILGGESFGIGNNVNVDEIWDFVEYMTEPERYAEFLKELGQLPADSVLSEDPYYTDDPINAVFIEQLKSAKPRAYGPQYNEMSKAIQTAISSAMSGAQTAQEALAEAKEIVTPLYDDYFNK